MNKGDVINGYEILQDFSVAGAGFSKWTFAVKDGREYFFKEFLSPTYPEADGPGSEKIKARKRARCEAFENQQRAIMEATRPVSSLGGNLIGTLDFFRWGAKYYKVTEQVEVAGGVDVAQVAALGFDDQLVILKSVAHSLKMLHDLGIVHSDLKPTNILIKKTALAHTAKLIDFDSAYLAGEPPPPEEIVGTINYYSPELVSYIQEREGTDPRQLGLPSDVFTLGLIYTEYLTGLPPTYDRERFAYPSTAAQGGAVLRVSPEKLRSDVPAEIPLLLERMMLLTSEARPSITDVHAALMKVRRGDPVELPPAVGTAAAPAPVPTAGGGSGSALKGRGLRTAARAPEPAAATTTTTQPPDTPPPDSLVPTSHAASSPAATSPAPATAAPTTAAPGPTPAPVPAAAAPVAEPAVPVEPAADTESEPPRSGLLGKLVRKVRKPDST